MGYTSAWSSKRQVIMDIANRVAREHPADWKIAHHRDAHNREIPGNDVYIRRVAFEVRKVFVDCGLNGKRGDANNISRDVLAFPNPAGCRDGSGRYLGLELIDIILNAGAPNQSVGFTDVTLDTINGGAIGAWVEPKAVEGGPVHVPEPETVIPPFPPRDQGVAFVNDLDVKYMERGREPIELHIDVEGLGVWYAEYLRYRQQGHTHDEAKNMVFDEIERIWQAEDDANTHD